MKWKDHPADSKFEKGPPVPRLIREMAADAARPQITRIAQMVFQHIPKAIDAVLGRAAAAEMAAHFAAVDPPAGAAPSEKTHGGPQPLRSLVCYLQGGRPADARRPEFESGPAVIALLEAVTTIFAAQLPEAFARQCPEPPAGEALQPPFTTITVNRNWATPLHRDSGTRPGSVVALVVIKDAGVSCPTVFRPHEGWPGQELELESGDVLLFQGVELEHGNPAGLSGQGTRWAFVFYAG